MHIPKDSKSSSGSEQQYFVGFYDNNSGAQSNSGPQNQPSSMTPSTVKHQKVLAAPEIFNEYPVLGGGMFAENEP